MAKWSRVELPERAASQVSLFGDHGAEHADAKPRLIETREWSDNERLTHEKASLGFYLSGHPYREYAAEFSSLLPRFQDDIETGRNRSLLASLDYSLRRLSQAQRTLLPRLALFEGGASEARLLAITEIPAAEWITLRQALEQAALLTAEQIERYRQIEMARKGGNGIGPVARPTTKAAQGV